MRGLMETGIIADPAIRLGYVQVERDALFMHRDTYRAINAAGVQGLVYDTMRGLPDGLHEIPARLFYYLEAEDVRRALAFVQPGPSRDCALPSCAQTAEAEHDGYRLCSHHYGLIR